MPSLDLLLLPLLGGFLFVSQWYPTKYSALRSAGYKLLFVASIAGSLLLFAATLIITSIYHTPLGEWATELWHNYVPFAHSGKAALSFLLGGLLWWPLNALGNRMQLRWLSNDGAVDRAIVWKRDPLELLLRQSLGSRQSIAVTLTNNKVYIGNLITNLNPAFSTESIHLLLHRSGHRDVETQKLTIDVDYDKTHATIREAVSTELRARLLEVARERPHASDEELFRLARERLTTRGELQNYEIAILTSEIVSVNFFDLQVYDQQFKPNKDTRQ